METVSTGGPTIELTHLYGATLSGQMRFVRDVGIDLQAKGQAAQVAVVDDGIAVANAPVNDLHVNLGISGVSRLQSFAISNGTPMVDSWNLWSPPLNQAATMHEGLVTFSWPARASRNSVWMLRVRCDLTSCEAPTELVELDITDAGIGRAVMLGVPPDGGSSEYANRATAVGNGRGSLVLQYWMVRPNWLPWPTTWKIDFPGDGGTPVAKLWGLKPEYSGYAGNTLLHAQGMNDATTGDTVLWGSLGEYLLDSSFAWFVGGWSPLHAETRGLTWGELVSTYPFFPRYSPPGYGQTFPPDVSLLAPQGVLVLARPADAGVTVASRPWYAGQRAFACALEADDRSSPALLVEEKLITAHSNGLSIYDFPGVTPQSDGWIRRGGNLTGNMTPARAP